ncbi:MAG: class I SAM-dependent methyltransferase [Patescibacteria group bacterium]|jgi:2-polyprenyl-3-methyl-5-hydroxy-6-metoxy-1,4-benzoquinol methylase
MKEESTNAKELHEKRAFSYTRVQEYHNQFIDPTTGAFDQKYLRTRACPVCAETADVVLFKKSGGTYVKCRTCSMVYTNPVFTDEALKIYYTNLDTGQGDIVADENDFYREIYQKGLQAISGIKSGGTLLDIGCSTGAFLDLAKNAGWTTSGIELGTGEADVAAKKGHAIFTEPIEQVAFEQPFDVMTLWDVFEHIPDGNAFLRTVRSKLRDDGVLFMQIPNSGALAAKVLRDACRMFDGLEHTNLYNPSTIRRMAEACGFKVVDLKSVISEVAVLNNYLSYEDPYFGESSYDNRAGLLGIIDEKLLHEHFFGYKLQVVLQKV